MIHILLPFIHAMHPPPGVALLQNSDHVPAIVDADCDLFSENYLESSYLGRNDILLPTNSVANAINDVVLSRVAREFILVTLSVGDIITSGISPCC
jgi:hypothetical protein